MIADTGGALAQREARRDRTIVRSNSATAGIQRLRYRAVWRSKHLVILPIDCHPFRRSVSAVLEGDRARLSTCLKHSHVKRLLLSPELEPAELLFWARLAGGAGLTVHLRLHREKRGLQAPLRLPAVVQQPLHYAVSVTLLLILSPLMLVISLAALCLTGSIFSREIAVGQGGKLFTALRFQSPASSTHLSAAARQVLTQSHLLDLPLLLNVLRGEMLIWGQKPALLTDPMKDATLSPISLHKRRELPGICNITSTPRLVRKT